MRSSFARTLETQMQGHKDAETKMHTHTCFDHTCFIGCLHPHSSNCELGRDRELRRRPDRNTHVGVWIARGVGVGEAGKGNFNGLFRAEARDEEGPIGVHHVHLSLAIVMVKLKCAREE